MLTPKKFDNRVLIEYKRNGKNQPIGVMVAIGRHAIGWSLCSPGDPFKKELGLHIALQRAVQAADMGPMAAAFFYDDKLPKSLEKLFLKMKHRSRLYFKETSILPEDDNSF